MVCVSMHVEVRVQPAEVGTLYYASARNWTQVIRFDNKYLHQLSHLDSHLKNFNYIFLADGFNLLIQWIVLIPLKILN